MASLLLHAVVSAFACVLHEKPSVCPGTSVQMLEKYQVAKLLAVQTSLLTFLTVAAETWAS
ncbi:uncharacterized protein UHOR_03024 [Ustilago hordei]|uniref:Uncharacterized protein n=1 Tax=Ustilago hordei TaxID=120017 RepID=I2FRK1_USTHO|nr:uncharacterized protein UHOR_03024 [Ustilago hordei]